ncbi:MAG: rRNA maturation RNase YbeY [Dysgonamonadaceae bacterium]|jgi:rRNA maturation RNase YbeY|nr:rRNA maturation RNase YbeY [Dysgonamonadaceae bacterium]
MAITFIPKDVKVPRIIRLMEVKGWIKQVAGSHQKEIDSIAFVFCSAEEILTINKKYLQHDYYTDIITFDYSEDNKLSGDVFLSPEIIKSNAAQYHTTYKEELLRVIIHGILHLCGFNDKESVEQGEMRAKEDEALKMIAL